MWNLFSRRIIDNETLYYVNGLKTTRHDYMLSLLDCIQIERFSHSDKFDFWGRRTEKQLCQTTITNYQK